MCGAQAAAGVRERRSALVAVVPLGDVTHVLGMRYQNLPTDMLRTFVAVAELKSFTRAGEVMGRTQPAVSLQIHSARLAFEQLTLLVKASEGGPDLAHDDIRGLLTMLVDIIVQRKRVDGTFRVTEVYYEPQKNTRSTGEI